MDELSHFITAETIPKLKNNIQMHFREHSLSFSFPKSI